jgi:hypothetical protein
MLFMRQQIYLRKEHSNTISNGVKIKNRKLKIILAMFAFLVMGLQSAYAQDITTGLAPLEETQGFLLRAWNEFFLIPKAHAQTPDLLTGLIGHWTFDEGSGTTVADSSGNNNTGTLVNGPTWDTGKIGGALSFDGSDDYVDASNLSYNTDYPLTVSLWIQPRA